jgi:hypothetical protein
MDDDQPTIDNTRKDPDDWKTGDDPMTGAQKSTIETMSGQPALVELSKADASKMIDELRQKDASGDSAKKDDSGITGAS